MGVLGGKHMQLLKDVMPTIKRMGVLLNTTYSPTSPEDPRLTERAGKVLLVSVVSVAVDGANDLDAEFAQSAKNRLEAVIVMQIALIARMRGHVVVPVARRGVPVVGTTDAWSNSSTFVSCGASVLEETYALARFVDKILGGARPADMPAEQATRFNWS